MLGQIQQSHDFKRKVKVVLLGDRSVGKSSIINRFITNQFQQNLQPTVGVDFLGKNVKYKGKNYRIQLWDTAGQQKYRSLVKGYLKGADACIFVYDCASISSYSSIPEWLNLFESVASHESLKIVVGNKCDAQFNSDRLQQCKKAIKQQHEVLKNIPEFVTSAKLGINIQQLFQQVLVNYTNKKSKRESNGKLSRVIGSVRKYAQMGCCK